MAKGKKEPVTLEGKVQKEMPEFAAEVLKLDSQGLKNRIANYAKELEESEECRENDEALEAAKSEVKELGAPYGDVRKAVRLKTRYLLSLLKEKGGA